MAKGKTDTCGCQTTLMTIFTSMNLHKTSGSLRLPHYITLVDSMATVDMWTT